MVPPASPGVRPRAPRTEVPPQPPLSAIPRSRPRVPGIPAPAIPADDATGRLEGLVRPGAGPRRSGLPPLVPRPALPTEELAEIEPLAGITGVDRPSVPADDDAASGAAAHDDAPRGTRRRLAGPPRRRGLLWLAALVIGGVVAAAPTLTGVGPTTPSAGAAALGLGNDANLDVGGDLGDADVRASITQAEAQLRLHELAASRADREPHTVLPAQGYMSTCFCMRWGTFHYGVDLAAPLGTPIYAATDGVVLRAGPASGFGNAVYIEDTDGNTEVYGHMRYYNVKAGQVVHAGDLIAKVGNEGQSTGPHLHFQIDKGSEYGKPINPLTWFRARGVQVPGS